MTAFCRSAFRFHKWLFAGYCLQRFALVVAAAQPTTSGRLLMAEWGWVRCHLFVLFVEMAHHRHARERERGPSKVFPPLCPHRLLLLTFKLYRCRPVWWLILWKLSSGNEIITIIIAANHSAKRGRRGAKRKWALCVSLRMSFHRSISWVAREGNLKLVSYFWKLFEY